MGSIRVLSDATINQIAAGEVVESPASVVKELVENSVDAKSKHIRVDVEGGGFTCIRVSDDGAGMSQDDALLSIERHATSKIASGDDLKTIATMGFRGEALASITSIAKVKLVTAKGAMATAVSMSGGKLISVDNAARSQGTTIEVRQLFFNVPARRKFQKSVGASTTEIVQCVIELSLAHPHVNIELFVNGEKRLGSNEITKLLGSDYSEHVFKIDCEDKGKRIQGVIGKPNAAKSSRRGQYFIVNGRAIKSPFLSKTIETAYGTRLGTREFPILALNLTLPPDSLDVNVHPQKTDVRFLEKDGLASFLNAAVNSAFKVTPRPVASAPLHRWSAEPQQLFVAAEPEQKELAIEHLAIIGLKSPYLFLAGESAPLTEHTKTRTGIVMVDLRCVEERIIHDNIQKRSSEMQSLLLPITLNYSPRDAEKLRGALDQIKECGIGMRSFGENAFVIEQLHPSIDQSRVANILEQVLSEKPEVGLLIRLLVQKKIYSVLEARALIKELLTCRDTATSPRGQPLFVHLDEKDIDRLFKTH